MLLSGESLAEATPLTHPKLLTQTAYIHQALISKQLTTHVKHDKKCHGKHAPPRSNQAASVCC